MYLSGVLYFFGTIYISPCFWNSTNDQKVSILGKRGSAKINVILISVVEGVVRKTKLPPHNDIILFSIVIDT